MTEMELIEELDRQAAEYEGLGFQKRELDRLLQGCDDEEGRHMQERMNRSILRVLYAFTLEGHSDFSAGYAIPKIARLLKGLPLFPITEEDGWAEMGFEKDGKVFRQNKRCSRVFKAVDKATGKVTYEDIEKYVFSDNGGATWFGNGGCCGIKELTNEVTLPYAVPYSSENVYVRKLEDGTYAIVTDKEEIEAMRREFRRRRDSAEWK